MSGGAGPSGIRFSGHPAERKRRRDSTVNDPSSAIRRFEDGDEAAVIAVWHRSGQAAYPYLPTWQALTRERAGEVFRRVILELHTHQENHAARQLYEKHGFRAVKFGLSPPPEGAPDVEYHWRGEQESS
jgi:hypothetical protein